MKTITIQIKNKQYICKAPEAFSELDTDQYITYIENMILKPGELDNTPEKKLNLLMVFLKYKNTTLPTKTWNTLIESERIKDLFQILDFLKTPPELNGQWYIPKLKIFNETYFGPKSNFQNMTFSEFIHADMKTSEITKDLDELAEENKLAELAAILFRKKRKFDPDKIETYKETMKWLNLPILYAIYFNFLAVRQIITKTYTTLFKKQDESNQQNEIQLGGNNNLTWLNIRRKIAGDVLKLEQVDNKNIHDLFFALNEQIIENKQNEK